MADFCAKDHSWQSWYEKKGFDALWEAVKKKKSEVAAPQCSFALYKELMKFFGKTEDWYGYSKECLKLKEEDKNNTEGYFIPAEDIRRIWNWKYSEYQNEAKESKGEGQNVSEKTKAACLGIQCFNASEQRGGTGNYELLSVENWTEEICEELNKTDFSKNFVLNSNKTNQDSATPTLKDVPVESLGDNFQSLEKIEEGKYKITKIYAYQKLPAEFVRFNHHLILGGSVFNGEEFDKGKIEKELVQKILSSIKENLGVIKNYEVIFDELLKKTEPITKDNYNKSKESLNKLREICALSAHFSPNKRPVNGADNQIWYELLQNANDHIPSDETEEKRVLKVTFNEENLVLEYPDKGFSVRDFFAICTEGNSANILSSEDREGKKGTGFKSVYNLFDEVTIESGPVQCTLKDKPIKVGIIEDNEIKVEESENAWESEKRYYPVPKFEDVSDSDMAGKTRISFHAKGDSLESIKKQIFGEEIDAGNTLEDLEEKFEKQRDYLFLDNIATIGFEHNVSSCNFDRKKVLEENYEKYEHKFSDDTISMDANPSWHARNDIEKETKEEKFKKKKKAVFLFPKKSGFKEGKGEASEKKVYCTLPINGFRLSAPFYVNLPLLELNNDRQYLASGPVTVGENRYSLSDWNKNVILEGLCKGYKEAVKHYAAQSDGAICLTNLYQYFPYKYLKEEFFANGVGLISWKGENEDFSLKKVKFLRAVHGIDASNPPQPCAYSDLVRNNSQEEGKTIFLPFQMYEWLYACPESGFKSEVSFVYYGEKGETEGEKEGFIIEDFIKEKFNNDQFDEFAKKYKPTGEGNVGKIIEEILGYIRTVQIPDDKKEAFYQWLKRLLGKISTETAYTYASYIYSAFFHAEYGLQYCGNVKGENWVSLEDKVHWLCKDGKIIEGEIVGYQSIRGYIIDLYKKLYERDDFNPDMLSRDLYRENAIKCCFQNLLESPYFSFKYDPVLISRGKRIEAIPDIRDVSDEILPGNNRMWDDEEEREELEELLCEYTKKLFENAKEDVRTTIQEWIKNGNVLYAKAASGNIVPITEKNYYVESNILEDFRGNEQIIAVGAGFVTSLESAIGNPKFFKENEGQKNLIEAVIKKFDLNQWESSAIGYICDGDKENEMKVFLFKAILEQTAALAKQTEPLEWNDAYKNLIGKLTLEELHPERNAFSTMDNSLLKPLSQELRQNFENRVSNKEKERIKEKSSTLQKFVEETEADGEDDIYILDCPTKNKSLYCKFLYHEKSVYVLFGEKSFGTFLRKEFECEEYSESRIFEEMQCGDVDTLNRRVQQIGDFSIAIEKKVEKLKRSWETNRDVREMKNQLVDRFGVKSGKKWFHARGYGSDKVENRKCPICGSVLISEMNLLFVKNVIYEENEKKHFLPMLMCGNCKESLNYANKVTVSIPKEGIDVKDNTAFQEFEITFEMNAREEKTLKSKVSFLNRYLWKMIIEEDNKLSGN